MAKFCIEVHVCCFVGRINIKLACGNNSRNQSARTVHVYCYQKTVIACQSIKQCTLCHRVYQFLMQTRLTAEIHGYNLYCEFVPCGQILYRNMMHYIEKHVKYIHVCGSTHRNILFQKSIFTFELYQTLVDKARIPCHRVYQILKQTRSNVEIHRYKM